MRQVKVVDIVTDKILTDRQSGIELIKIIALFMIVLYHVCTTIGSGVSALLPSLSQTFFDANLASSDIQHMIIGIFLQFGSCGNIIFFVCSFWFLSSSNEYPYIVASRNLMTLKTEHLGDVARIHREFKVKKIILMLMDVWVISVIYFLIIINYEEIPVKYIVKSFFPNLFCNNWFITCYLIMYLIHPLLNIIVDYMNKKMHASFCVISLFIYSICVFIRGSGTLFSSELVQALVLYFLVAYIKKYTREWIKNAKINVMLLLIGIAGVISMYLITNYLGLHYSIFGDKALRWCSTAVNNPFNILLALALFNLFSNLDFSNKVVNYISGLSMLIYLFHENQLFRAYTRVRIWSYLLDMYGEQNIVLMSVLFAIALFVVAIVVSFIYRNTLQKLVRKVEEKIEPIIMKNYNCVLNAVMKVK